MDLSRICDDILLNIQLYLPFSEWVRLTSTCKRLWQMCKRELGKSKEYKKLKVFQRSCNPHLDARDLEDLLERFDIIAYEKYCYKLTGRFVNGLTKHNRMHIKPLMMKCIKCGFLTILKSVGVKLAERGRGWMYSQMNWAEVFKEICFGNKARGDNTLHYATSVLTAFIDINQNHQRGRYHAKSNALKEFDRFLGALDRCIVYEQDARDTLFSSAEASKMQRKQIEDYKTAELSYLFGQNPTSSLLNLNYFGGALSYGAYKGDMSYAMTMSAMRQNRLVGSTFSERLANTYLHTSFSDL